MTTNQPRNDETDSDRDDPLENSRPPGGGKKEGSPMTGRERPFDEEPESAEAPGDDDAPGRWVVDPDSGPPAEPNEPA